MITDLLAFIGLATSVFGLAGVIAWAGHQLKGVRKSKEKKPNLFAAQVVARHQARNKGVVDATVAQLEPHEEYEYRRLYMQEQAVVGTTDGAATYRLDELENLAQMRLMAHLTPRITS